MRTGRQISKITLILLTIALLAVSGALVYMMLLNKALPGEEDRNGYKGISTPDGLMAVAGNPEGKYILECDIDMTGITWTPFTFRGVLDGNGHEIHNLSVKAEGTSARQTYDGNMKVYDTYFAALFDVLDHGEVRNLTLTDVNVEASSDRPCFAGSIAGYLDQGTVSNCVVKGSVTLRAHDRMFGVGGIAGYGNGRIDNSVASVTLVCIDTDRNTRDEQFMGGICAGGYPDIVNCVVNIDGYVSEHGYCHNGGLMGMYIFYPEGTVYEESEIANTVVNGRITFFEDNSDRRAYCKPDIGEMMSRVRNYRNNVSNFVSDEVFEYDKDLVP